MMITFCRVSHGLHWTVHNPEFSCETKQCVDVTIVGDVVLENVESFHVTLERTSGLDMRITCTLDPVDGIINIRDNDKGEFY